MAPLDTGRFIIINSKSKNVVYLADANSCSDLRGDCQQNRPGEIWNIVLLSNGNYTIKNYGYGSYATCEFIAKPAAGNNIVGGNSDHQQQWMIIEQGTNSYVICPTTNGHVYWHLTDVESGTPITLEPYSQTNKIRWEFIKLEDAEEPGGGGETGRVRGNNDAPSTPVQLPNPVKLPNPVLVPTRTRTLASASSLSSESLVLRSIIPGSRYEIRIAGTDLYLGVPFFRSTVASDRQIYSDSWLITRRGVNWRIQLWRSKEYLSIPKFSEGRVSDDPTDLSLTPIGGQNEFRITEVNSGRSWGGLVFEFYE